MGRKAHSRRHAYWMWGDDDPDMAEQERRILAFAGASRARLTPSKPAMYREGPEALLDGWLPREPLIDADTRVIAIGSCFASLFAEWLAGQGFNRAFDPTSDISLVRNPLETPAIVAQQFRWAFGELTLTWPSGSHQTSSDSIPLRNDERGFARLFPRQRC